MLMSGDDVKESEIVGSLMRLDDKRKNLESLLLCISGFGDELFGAVLGESKGEKISGEGI